MAFRRLRSIRPPDDIVPNPNPPESVPPATVGPPSARPGDPHGVVLADAPAIPPPPRITRPMPWSGWPGEWSTPGWNGHGQSLLDTVWLCLDLNTGILCVMPPYLTGSADTLSADWLRNPDPDIYSSWEEFARQLFWDYSLGEAFVLVTARYATDYPARFHVVPPWYVEVDMDSGMRRYRIGGRDVSRDILHLRYKSSVDNARGVGPLEAGAPRLLAAQVLSSYAYGLAASGGVPPSILTADERLDDDQALALKQQWIEARLSGLGEPAVLSGGVHWEATQVSATDMALVELLQFNESRVALLLGMPPHLIGLPSGGDSMTYANTTSLYEFHWRAMLAPRAVRVCADLSGWALPRGTGMALNPTTYTAPDPQVRAQIEETYNRIRDAQDNPVLTVEEIRRIEHFDERMKLEGAPR